MPDLIETARKNDPAWRLSPFSSAIERRTFLTGSAAFALGFAAARCSALAQPVVPDPELSAKQMITPAAQKAIENGLRHLADRQTDDGAFVGGLGIRGEYNRNVAVIALAGMAFMSSGSVPARGPYGDNVTRCVRYILESCQEDGFIIHDGTASHGPMYGHGFATMFLAEVYGMWPDGDVRERLTKAVDVIVKSQNKEGGWRYYPQPRDADVSVTVCQVMTLRSARNAGIYVPKETIDRSIDYVKRCQNPDGGFMYMLQGGESEFPRSAAGIVALYSAGIYEGDEIEKGLDYLMQHIPRTTRRTRDTHIFYGHYYAVQAMWHAGGERWQQWYPAVRDALIQWQEDDGSWVDPIGPEYATAMACIVLQMPNNFLPIFQR